MDAHTASNTAPDTEDRWNDVPWYGRQTIHSPRRGRLRVLEKKRRQVVKPSDVMRLL